MGRQARHMTTLLVLMSLSVIGLGLNLALHIASLVGGVGVPFELFKWQSLYLALVLMPAFLIVSFPLKEWWDNKWNIWRFVFRGCPPWMCWVAGGLFAYAVLQHVFFLGRGGFDHIPRSDTGRVVLEGTSCLAAAFYWMAFAIYWSARNRLKSRTH